MKRSILLILSFVMAIAAASSCRRNHSNEKRYELEGKVVIVEPDKHLVTIAHDEIKGYMPGMTMPFTVTDDAALQILANGDQVSATLVLDGSHSWLENLIIRKESIDSSPAASGVPEAKEGDEVPNYRLMNQDGREIRIQNYRGKTLLLTFIYTKCPLPEYCNLMSTNFATIDRELQKDPTAYDQTHLLSISIDPERDTPQVLRSYGAAFTERYQDESFSHWEFATGTKDEVKGIAQFFGLRYFADSDQIVHGLRTAVVGPDGRVVKVYRDNQWKPEEVLRILTSLDKLDKRMSAH
ncbi:MAG: SCO family protein [Pyrinomonadaceae bacterium]